jgi:hypothetical protein
MQVQKLTYLNFKSSFESYYAIFWREAHSGMGSRGLLVNICIDYLR